MNVKHNTQSLALTLDEMVEVSEALSALKIEYDIQVLYSKKLTEFDKSLLRARLIHIRSALSKVGWAIEQLKRRNR